MANENKTILFSLPDFYNLFPLNMNLIKMMQDYPGWFRDNVKVDSIYGSFPGCIWNSGRGQFGQSPLENIVQTIAAINKEGVSIRYTFTNSLIEQRHFKDYYGNTILAYSEQTGMGVKNGVNVAVPEFAQYIEDNYPNLYLMWSTTMTIKSVDRVNELSEDRLTVPPYTMNNTDAIYDFAHPENIELLCCEACIDSCPNRAAHYADISKGQMLLPSKGFKCPHNCEMYYYYDLVPNRKHHITYESMVEDYLPNGINKFKISGRNDNVINVIERYAEYFPRDEYRDQVRNHLLIDFFNNRPN